MSSLAEITPTLHAMAAARGKNEEAFIEARNKVVVSYLPWARSVAGKARERGVPTEDLAQAASLGLIRACDLWNPEFGYKFSTYAQWWIRAEIKKALFREREGTYYPPRRLRHLAKVAKHRAMSARETGEIPNTERLAELTQLSVGDVEAALEVEYAMAHHLLAHHLECRREEWPDAAIDPARRAQLAWKVLSRLTPIEAFIISERFGLGTDEELRLAQLGRLLGVSRERIRQVEAKALAKCAEVAAKMRVEL